MNNKELILSYVKENFEEETQCGIMSLLLKYERFKESKAAPAVDWDYEILKFKHIDGKIDDRTGHLSTTDIRWWLNDKDWFVYSVKCLSTGSIFTICDKVRFAPNPKNPYVIHEFFIRGDGKMLARAENIQISEYVDKDLEHVPKEERKPLFKTADNVSVFMGDVFWAVDDTYTLLWNKAPAEIPPYNYLTTRTFSTEKAAKDYILHKKPVLCYDDVIDNVGISRVTSLDRLYELVKQRI